jgi:hypothetical protein
VPARASPPVVPAVVRPVGPTLDSLVEGIRLPVKPAPEQYYVRRLAVVEYEELEPPPQQGLVEVPVGNRSIALPLYRYTPSDEQEPADPSAMQGVN